MTLPHTATIAPVLSALQTRRILEARRTASSTVTTTLDLGLTSITLPLTDEGLLLPDAHLLTWLLLEEIDADPDHCFTVTGGAVQPIKRFSHRFGRSYSLLPTATAPALIMAGFPMHRVKGTDPCSAARAMVAALAPVRGPVLDTATGLGYTAIEMAKTAQHVVTIEQDAVALEIAAVNPWSQPLFGKSLIRQVVGDCCEEVRKFGAESFARILHDPPAQSLAGDLYSGAFYAEAFRVLRPGGRMFHYIGDPATMSGGRTTQGVIRRLHDAGFARVERRPEAFGVVAYK